jgi:hypothetical protein
MHPASKETQMSYIINVAKKRLGTTPPKHIFRTAKDSIHSRQHAIEVCRDLGRCYPREFYEINLSVDTTHSEYIDWETTNV